MRKLLFVLGLLLGAASVKAGGVSGTAGADTDPTRAAEYLDVTNSDAVAHASGTIVIWSDMSLLKVSTTTSASSKLAAGVVVGSDGLPASGKGRIQVYGYHSAVKIAVANALGDCVGTSTTAESSTVTTTVGACLGTALEVTTTSTTVKTFIHAK